MVYLRLLLSAVVCGILLLPADVSASGKADYEKEYLFHKSKENYLEALKVLGEWSLTLRDQIQLETNVFRIEELLMYPECFDAVSGYVESLAGNNPAVRENPDIHARLDMVRNLAFLRKNMPAQARTILRRWGFLETCRILGPFNNYRASDFDAAPTFETVLKQDRIFHGKHYPVHWFDGETNLRGKIDIKEIECDTRNSLYYLKWNFNVHTPGTYILYVGKTGYTDIWINGVTVFKNRKRHAYGVDQYRIVMELVRGTHRVLVKTGDAEPHGIKISLRITNERGEGISTAKNIPDPAVTGMVKVKETSWFRTLAALAGNKNTGGRQDFITAYLIIRAGLDSEEDREADRFLQAAVKYREWAHPSSYYMAFRESQSEKKEHYLRMALVANPGCIESMLMLAGVKLSSGFLYEALPLIEEAKKQNPSTAGWAGMRVEAFKMKGWYHEALKISLGITHSLFPSRAYAVRADIESLQEKYHRALSACEELLRLDAFNRNALFSALECCEKAGLYEKAVTLIETHLELYTRDVQLRTLLAKFIGLSREERAALAYLGAALKISPFNRNLCLMTGNLYRAMGNRELGMYFLRQACSYGPGDFSLRQYYDSISGNRADVDEFLVRTDIEKLAEGADRYANEPAVVLLDEYVVRILPDESHERWFRKVIRIQDPGSIGDFSRHYIVYNPVTDRVENARLSVTTDGSTIETDEGHTRSLSDPESSLYYDLKVKVLTAQSLRKGSIVDFSYCVRSNEGRLYHGYFGQSFTAGSEYRTLKTNIVVSVPSNKKLYHHLAGINKKALTRHSTDGRLLYHVVIDDIAPFKKEHMMPHFSEIQPAVVITSHRDWHSVYLWYEGLIKDKAVVTDEMRAKISALISPDDPVPEKIRKIYNFVTSQIRYAGFELGIGGLQPRSSDTTFRSGMGDCKDVTMLLISLLRECGIKAGFALIRTREKGEINRGIPYLGQFNHAICHVDYEKGIFLDATSKLTGFRELPPGDRDVSAFVLKDKGYEFINTGGSFYLENRERAATVVTINDDGAARCRRTIIKEGYFASTSRYELLNREGKVDRISTYWNDRYTGARVGTLTVLSHDTELPVSYSYALDIPALVRIHGRYATMKSFLAPSDYFSGLAVMKNRKYPILLPGPSETLVSIQYRLPESWSVVRLPNNESRSYRNFNASFEYFRKTPTLLEIRSVIRFKEYRIPAADYADFREFARFIHQKENERIVLKKTAGEIKSK